MIFLKTQKISCWLRFKYLNVHAGCIRNVIIKMEQKNVSARIELNPYSNKVLAVLKAKYGLKDKSEAINKFMEIFGDEVVERESNDNYIKEMINGVKEHIKRHGYKSMSSRELDKLFGM